MTRESIIIRTSVIGIAANIFLAAFKAFVGLITSSIAIVLDAVNNLSDALSSVITIVGTRLASKLPDKKHPFGHGRIEYLTGLLVAGIVLYAGIVSGVESVKKIINPVKPDYSMVTLIVIIMAIIVKLILGTYVKATGEKVNSTSLVASGKDALFDGVISVSVLVSALIYMIWGVLLEAYVGLLISAFIIKAGLEMIEETVSNIVGQRSDRALTSQIKSIMNAEPEVMGAYDLVLYNYGPEKEYGAVHIEVLDTMTAGEIDILTRKLERNVFEQTGVLLTGIGIYSVNTKDPEVMELKQKVYKAVNELPFVVQTHGFFAEVHAKRIRFDVVLSFEIDPEEGLDKVYEVAYKLLPEYEFNIAPDVDISVTDIE
jgi:cation diffusion facilitator family transporter